MEILPYLFGAALWATLLTAVVDFGIKYAKGNGLLRAIDEKHDQVVNIWGGPTRETRCAAECQFPPHGPAERTDGLQDRRRS